MAFRPFLEHVAEYEAWFMRNPHAYRSELQAVQRALAPTAPPRLEVGVGTGLFAEPLGISLGLEPAPPMAEQAARRERTSL